MENSLKIDNLIKFFIKENNLENGLENVKIKDLWYEQMKNGVANYTTDINLKNGTLYIKLKSSDHLPSSNKIIYCAISTVYTCSHSS